MRTIVAECDVKTLAARQTVVDVVDILDLDAIEQLAARDAVHDRVEHLVASDAHKVPARHLPPPRRRHFIAKEGLQLAMDPAPPAIVAGVLENAEKSPQSIKAGKPETARIENEKAPDEADPHARAEGNRSFAGRILPGGFLHGKLNCEILTRHRIQEYIRAFARGPNAWLTSPGLLYPRHLHPTAP